MQKTPEEREKYCKSPIFGTDLSKPTSACIEDLRTTIMKACGQLDDIMFGKGWEDRVKHVEGLLTCGLVVLHVAMKEIYEFELKQLEHELGSSFSFGSRGIGLDLTPGCFCCGSTKRNASSNDVLHNIAAHIDKNDETAVLVMFPRGARMGYYHGDPMSPQIKIGACDKHLPNLQHLHDRTYYYRRIREADVKAAMDFNV